MYFPEDDDGTSTQASDLLKTIVFPRNFHSLIDKLPRPSYEDEVRLHQIQESKHKAFTKKTNEESKNPTKIEEGKARSKSKVENPKSEVMKSTELKQ